MARAANWAGHGLIRYVGRSGAVARASDSRLREPGFESWTVMLNVGQVCSP